MTVGRPKYSKPPMTTERVQTTPKLETSEEDSVGTHPNTENLSGGQNGRPPNIEQPPRETRWPSVPKLKTSELDFEPAQIVKTADEDREGAPDPKLKISNEDSAVIHSNIENLRAGQDGRHPNIKNLLGRQGGPPRQY